MRALLATARQRVLAGVSIVFSAVYPKTPGAGDRWWALAKRVRNLIQTICSSRVLSVSLVTPHAQG